MGSWFVGATAYADDIVLMAPILPLQCVECWPCVMNLRLNSTLGLIHSFILYFRHKAHRTQ